jgi:hypothetical protein
MIKLVRWERIFVVIDKWFAGSSNYAFMDSMHEIFCYYQNYKNVCIEITIFFSFLFVLFFFFLFGFLLLSDAPPSLFKATLSFFFKFELFFIFCLDFLFLLPFPMLIHYFALLWKYLLSKCYQSVIHCCVGYMDST